MKLEEIAKIIDAKFQGDPEFVVDGLASSPGTGKFNELAFVFAPKFSRFEKMIKDSQVKAFIVCDKLLEDENFVKFTQNDLQFIFLFVKRPKFAMHLLMKYFQKTRFKPSGIHGSAIIDQSARIAEGVSIGPLSYVGPNTRIGSGTVLHARVVVQADCEIGNDCVLHSGVVVEDYSVIGNRVEIQANAVIGSDGYSYITEEPSNLEKLQKGDFNFSMDRQIQHKVNSAGFVIIHDDVEIGAGTCVDRGTIAATEIGSGTKIDNLCQIAHNVRIGKDCIIIGQSGIAGSAVIGDRVTLAGSTGVGDGVEIGNDVVVAAFSAVNSNLDPFLPVIGLPAIAYGEFMRRQRAIARLPKQQEEMRRLKTKVEELSRKFT